MTTRSTNPVSRETSAFVRERGLRALVITVHEGLLTLRPKGLRTSEVVDLAAVYNYAVKSRLAWEKHERAKSKKRK